jgi:hypothetical protein
MRIPRKLLWLAFIAGSIFFWMVFFEYGYEPRSFLNGAREELSKMFSRLARALDQ